MTGNEYTFRGSNSVIFVFAFHFNGYQLLKERNCSSLSKFFPYELIQFSKGYVPYREAKKKQATPSVKNHTLVIECTDCFQILIENSWARLFKTNDVDS